MSRVTIGVVGCGYWGPNLIRNFRSLSECHMKVMCDLDRKRLKHLHEVYPDVEQTVEYGALLADPQIDAIAIATPVRTHFSMAKEALLAGKHIFIEKPMASSVRECEDLIRLAHEHHRVLMIGHTFLYSSVVRRIKEIVSSGDIGDIHYICSRRLNLGLFQQDINVTWDLAPHDISIILYILGETPVAVNCAGSAHVAPKIEDVTTVWLSFKNNRSAIIQSSWLDPRKVREMTIVGSKRMLVYDDVAQLEKIKIFDTRVEAPPHYDTFADFHYAYHYGDMYIPHIKQEEPLKVECQHFIDCIERRGTPLSGGKEGVDLVRILEACSMSLKQNGAVVEIGEPAPVVNGVHRAAAVASKRVNGRTAAAL